MFTFAAIGLAFVAMALGVLMGRSPLVRGCAALEGKTCRACTRPCSRRAADPAPEES